MSDPDRLSSTLRIDLGKYRAVSADETGPSNAASPSDISDDTRAYALLDNVYDAALVTTLDGIVVRANPRAVEFLGYTAEEFRRLPFARVVSGVTPELMASIRDHLDHDRFALIQGYCIRKDGSSFPAEIAANLLSREEGRLCFFIRDITRRKQTEDMIRTGHLAMQNAANGIAVLNPTGDIQFVNPAFSRIWGFRPDQDPVKKHFGDLVVESDLVLRMLREVLTLQREWRGEMQARTADGALAPIQVTAAGNRDSEGAVTGAVLSVVDLRETKRAEQAMREAEQRQAMLASIGAACHHLAQPATVILGNLDLLNSEAPLGDSERQRMISEALAAARTLAELLHRLNQVEHFRTTPYLQSAPGSADGSQMLQI